MSKWHHTLAGIYGLQWTSVNHPGKRTLHEPPKIAGSRADFPGDNRKVAFFCDFRSLLREIKSSYHPDTAATEMEVLRTVLEAEPLVLDDLGGESPTLWVLDTFFFILNQRYNEKKLTIITTNYSDKPASTGPVSVNKRSARMGAAEATLADRITVRLRSRLYEMCRDVRIDGDDYRQSTMQANFHS